MSIEVKEVSKSYGNQLALQSLSFTIDKGEIVGFLGPNGAGKSTMMKILTGYLKADTGHVLLNGKPTLEKSLEVKKLIGYLPEQNPLYEDLYVREYLEFQASIYKISKNKIEEVIEKVALTTECHKKINQLSKGYQQRVGLAAAILHDPEVLILDEPTTGLDPNQLKEIRGLIKELAKDKTILFSTHILQEVEAICDRVIIINKGELLYNKKEKKSQKELEELFSSLTLL